jgi:hypothetical protein
MNDRSQRPIQASELARLDAHIDDLTRIVTLDALRRSGRTAFRVVSRGGLIREVLQLVQTFVLDRASELETRFGGIVAEREREAREEGRFRVLESIVDLAELAGSIAALLADGPHAAAGKTLDRRLDRLFRTHGFSRIETDGVPFDSRWHEIVAEEWDDRYPEGHVIREISRGYRNDEFVLRVARVVINQKE